MELVYGEKRALYQQGRALAKLNILLVVEFTIGHLKISALLNFFLMKQVL
jgi:hypothetical protein